MVKMIPEMLTECKRALLEHQKALGTIGIIALSVSLFLGLAKISWLYSSREPVRIEEVAQLSANPALSAPDPKTALYVASKAGTRYYLQSCKGANTIKESNKIYFNTKTEAEARGLTPAASCKGL